MMLIEFRGIGRISGFGKIIGVGGFGLKLLTAGIQIRLWRFWILAVDAFGDSDVRTRKRESQS